MKNYRDKFFKTHDLHERLEIIRELSKYNSQEVQRFFYAINGHIRNQSLKIEVQPYFQNLWSIEVCVLKLIQIIVIVSN